MRRVRACWRKSVDVSTRMYRTALPTADGPSRAPMSMRIDGRVRVSRGSVDRQTAQRQPMNGMPCDVPLPKTVTCTTRGSGLGTRSSSRVDDAWRLPARLEEAHPQLVEHLLEHLTLFGRQVAPRLLFEQREDVDHLRRALEVRRG